MPPRRLLQTFGGLALSDHTTGDPLLVNQRKRLSSTVTSAASDRRLPMDSSPTPSPSIEVRFSAFPRRFRFRSLIYSSSEKISTKPISRCGAPRSEPRCWAGAERRTGSTKPLATGGHVRLLKMIRRHPVDIRIFLRSVTLMSTLSTSSIRWNQDTDQPIRDTNAASTAGLRRTWTRDRSRVYVRQREIAGFTWSTLKSSKFVTPDPSRSWPLSTKRS
jgi:hypothetical protein